jgi:hypothetical protein
MLREQPGVFLAMLGDDGGQWGRAFCQFVKKNHDVDLPELWVAGWFSNCIGYNHELLRGGPMSLQDTDASAAAVAKAPRVTLADIERSISLRLDTTGGEIATCVPWNEPPVDGASADPPKPADMRSLEVLSICLLVMQNGFTVIGKSAPASSENYDADLGRKFAYEDAVRQLWPLMGYALREHLWSDNER